MRARIILTGLVVIGAACSAPADPAVEPVADDASAAPDLALTSSSDAVPVASDIEVHRPQPTPEPEPHVPTPEPADLPEPRPEPIGFAMNGVEGLTPEPMPVATSHVDPEDADEAVSGPSIEGGGKPTGIATGLGPVPERNWGDTGIIDDPNPVPIGIGREGAVIIRGGRGGVHDDCAKHPRGGHVAGGGETGGPGALVNDRDPRRGALINERAPRTSSRPSIPRGGGFPRSGIR